MVQTKKPAKPSVRLAVGEHPGRNEGVVVALRPVGTEGGIHRGIVVDDAVDLDAKEFDIRLLHRRRDPAVPVQPRQHLFRRIGLLQSLVGADHRDRVEELVGVDLPGERNEETGGEVRGLHAQRLVAEGLEVRLALGHFGHVRPSGWSRSTWSYRVRSPESLTALEATCSAL